MLNFVGVPYFGKEFKEEKNSFFGGPAESAGPYRHCFLPLFWPGFGQIVMEKARIVRHEGLFLMLPVFPTPGCNASLLDLGRK